MPRLYCLGLLMLVTACGGAAPDHDPRSTVAAAPVGCASGLGKVNLGLLKSQGYRESAGLGEFRSSDARNFAATVSAAQARTAGVNPGNVPASDRIDMLVSYGNFPMPVGQLLTGMVQPPDPNVSIELVDSTAGGYPHLQVALYPGCSE